MYAEFDGLSRTIRRMYEGACGSPDDTSGMDALRDYVGAEHVVFSTYADGAISWRACSNIMPSDHYRIEMISERQDYQALLKTRVAPETAVCQSSLMPPSEMRRSDAYQDLLKPMDGGLAALLYWQNPDGWTGVGICRSLVRGIDFSDCDVERLQILAPHMKAANQLMRQTVQASRTLAVFRGALDAMDAGLIVLDENERVVFMNAQADRLIRARDGLAMAGSSLRCATSAATDALHKAIGVVSGFDPMRELGAPIRTRIGIPRPASRQSLVVTIAPAAPLQGLIGVSSGAAVALLIHDPEINAPIPEDDLMAIYGLTRREAQLAARLAGGDTLAVAAQRLGVLSSTARQYLKCVFEKVGVSRQADLVRRLLQACR